ncbi:MAG: 7TM receptor with intracellular metal dependent phosphohydrolase [Thermotoga sp. 50_1627]|uniref:HDIG domain-containing metalloprotein n=1 Tax=Pseudothermotoga sp. TaxID=2033661 RepID=UPI00076BC696|nr:MAG: 7TM receptor with intracellular metal dependent phosphohydrolase [Thermotoga sp. 50_64]KUK25702.1 MAG: 7TM receptor with intracellular metal dependent phosphohydrolase [Thermotoga sp. 50_1627]MBC7115615.1 HD domain-containing protein [Pseudothermotoga sp.]HBT39967.1 phosphohydrolase [Pseudothermotoga sp.]HCO98490.1 phosphohydrolase [Pseudothermotoga sp.]
MALINSLLKKWYHLLFVFISLFLVQFPNLHDPARFLAEYAGLAVLWLTVVSTELDRKPFSLHGAYSALVLSTLVAGSFVSRLVLRRFGIFSSPFFAPILLLGLLTDRRLTVSVAVFSSALLIVSIEPSSLEFSLLLVCNIVAAVASSGLKKRLQIVRPAFFAVVCNVSFLLLGFFSKEKVVFDRNLLLSLIMPFLFSVVDLGLLPFVEYASLIYSDIDLVELGNMNHPLIKLLSLRAPGTYYHSAIVANLAEAAAEKIGANPILARTAAYFHDVGKVKRPYFYTENIEDKNPHDELNPKLSHLIVLDHVKYGQELARRHRLPLLVQDVIPQHHGTRVQKYFYHKAKEMGENLSEDEFRYTGPKPQFKEAGIIMLADSVEAAFRSVKNPTASRIRSLVEEIVSGIYNERELDESGLTLKDLEAVADEFARVLLNMFKSRIEYPKEEIKKVIVLAENPAHKSDETPSSDQENSESP